MHPLTKFLCLVLLLDASFLTVLSLYSGIL